MLNLSDRGNQEDAAPSGQPMTPHQRANLVFFVGSFVLWLPLYLFVVRPWLNEQIFRVIPSYPAIVLLLPIFGVPFALMYLHDKFGGERE